jgi:hypothetical protein
MIIRKDLEGNVLGLILVISRNILRRTEDNHERIFDVHAEIRTERHWNSSSQLTRGPKCGKLKNLPR